MFSCGRTSPHFSCSQECLPILSTNLTQGDLCDDLECQASDNFQQICSQLSCNAMSCTSKECYQRLLLADCGSMVCKRSVNNYEQLAQLPLNGQIMICDGKLRNQRCQSRKNDGLCDMKCSETAGACEQRGISGKYRFKCSAGVKNCTQNADLFAIGQIECDADSCVQSCYHSTCSMSCSSSVQMCMQSEDGFASEEIIMNCDADVCKQHCGVAACNMTCASSVKVCFQTCKRGNCVVRCDAEKCYGEKGLSSTTSSPSWVLPTNAGSHVKGTWLFSCLKLVYLLVYRIH